MNSNAQASNQANAIRAKNEGAAKLVADEQARAQQANDVFTQTLQPFQGDQPARNLQTAQAADTAGIQANAPVRDVLAGGATSANAPKVVQTAADNSIASRMTKMGQEAQNLGALTGYGSANGATGRNLSNANLKIGTIGNLAGQDANVDNALTNANMANSQKPIGPAGDLLGAAGQLGSFYAGKNGAFDNIFNPIRKVTSTPINAAFAGSYY
jgi:hypothetical protein